MTENPILKHQKLTILQQISDLKDWHKQQQTKLNQENEIHNNIGHSEDITKPLNVDKSKKKSEIMKPFQNNKCGLNDFDNTPVKGVNQNVCALIDNNIAPIEINHIQENENRENPKFKFLRRGEGIARFRMRPIKLKKKSDMFNSKSLHKSENSERENTLEKKDTSTQFKKIEPKIKLGEMPYLQTPNLKVNFKNWKSIFDNGNTIEVIDKALDNNQLDIFQPNCSIDTTTASIMERLIPICRKRIQEREEMRVFEAIEQHILDSSFSSTSTYVTNLMENAVMSTPEKKAPKHRDTENGQSIETFYLIPNVPLNNNEMVNVDLRDEDCTNSEKTSSVPKVCDNENTSNKGSVVINKELDNSFHVHFNDEIDYHSFIERSKSISNSRNLEINDSEQKEVNEGWKEHSCEGVVRCCQLGSCAVSLDEDILIDNTFENHCQKLSEDIDDRGGSDLPHCPVGKLEINDLSTENISSCDEKLSSFPLNNMITHILNVKVKLEREIKLVLAEKNKLNVSREKLEKERKHFLLEKKRFLKEIENEKKNNAAQLEEEKQKLSKEKLIFQKYSKSLTKNLSREERKEIQVLREQLSEIKEELNKKESRWGAAQARVRNQVKLLEQDNKKLREEIEILRRQSKSSQILSKNKKVFNNTKLIHDINDHLSNLATVSDSSLRTGYHNSVEDRDEIVDIENIDPENTVINKKDTHQLISSNDVNNTISTKINSSRDDKNIDINNHSLQKVFVNQKENTDNKGSVNEIINEPTQQNSSQNQVGHVLTISVQEIIDDEGNVEKTYPDGRKEITFKNGNIKKFDPTSGSEKTLYFNGDVIEVTKNGIIKYYFSENRIWQTTFPDGLEVLDFPDGQVEKRHTDGVVEILYPNNCKKITYPNGVEQIFYADKTNIMIEGNRKVLSFPNGQKEIHTDECISREYPDGTVKKVYSDGTTETVYSNGRVRLRDKHGNLVRDSGPPK